MKVDQETRMTMRVLAEKGQSGREIARVLGVDESTVRYHLKRQSVAATDGRADQRQLAEVWAEDIGRYTEALGDNGLNLAELHAWLAAERGYTGSLRSLQRYYRRHHPVPKKRARRRVETPPGAQSQADWAEWPRVSIAGRYVYAYVFHLLLSFSRFGARVWSPRKDQLAWQTVHNEAFRRIEGITATVRVDNEKTAVSRGAGSWGERNPSYKRYAQTLRFHIDLCPPRTPQAKGKVERDIGSSRYREEILDRDWESWEELQAWTDADVLRSAERRVCPATGTSVLEAWEQEKPWLTPVPCLPEPFDLAQMRVVADDCTVTFEGRRYSVPFAHIGRRIEVRGCSRIVQMYAEGTIIAQHERHGRERIVLDPRHYEGPETDRVLPPTPLGRMGRRLQEIAQMRPETRPLDLYAALAEVAR